MRIILFLFILTFDNCICQISKTIYESLKTYSPGLYEQLQYSKELIDLFDQTNYNITFLLPNEAALNNSLETGLLNFSSPNVYNSLALMTLNNSFTTQSFLSKRQFYQSITGNNYILIGNEIINNKATNNIQLSSGMTKAQTTSTEIQCSNGMIHFIDNFLQSAETPLTTISNLPETEYMEGLLKSLNVSDTISGINKTIFVPINEAWESINGSTLPFGTLVHNLKYSVIDGIYTLDRIINLIDPITNSTTVMTDYNKATIGLHFDNNSNLFLNENTLFVKSDILTTNSIFHLIDHVLLADSFDTNKSQNTVSSSSTDSPTLHSNFALLVSPSNYLILLFSFFMIYIL